MNLAFGWDFCNKVFLENVNDLAFNQTISWNSNVGCLQGYIKPSLFSSLSAECEFNGVWCIHVL